MLTILFWNIKGVSRGKPLSPSDTRYINLKKWLAEEAFNSQFGVPLDMVILAESPFKGRLDLPGMKCASTFLEPNRKTGCVLELYYRDTLMRLESIGDAGRTTIQKVTFLNSDLTMLIAAAHLESPIYQGREADRENAVEKLAGHLPSADELSGQQLTNSIGRAERKQGHKRTMLVGDLNFNPYDRAIYGANYLHAVPTRDLASKRNRIIDGRERWFFYNPMWAHFADGEAPAGTYYKRTSSVECRFWHMPDQLLLRPDLLPYWRSDNDLMILTRVGSHAIVKSGNVPNADIASDHLPLLFHLHTEDK